MFIFLLFFPTRPSVPNEFLHCGINEVLSCVCSFRDFRSEEDHSLTTHFWLVLAARFAFVILFEVCVGQNVGKSLQEVFNVVLCAACGAGVQVRGSLVRSQPFPEREERAAGKQAEAAAGRARVSLSRNSRVYCPAVLVHLIN